MLYFFCDFLADSFSFINGQKGLSLCVKSMEIAFELSMILSKFSRIEILNITEGEEKCIKLSKYAIIIPNLFDKLL